MRKGYVAYQLLRENNQAAGKTWVYIYDAAGNILSKVEYAYTEGTLGTAQDTINYTYGDSTWGDILTVWNGNAFSYDAIGNMTADAAYSYTYEHGRQLASMSRGSTTWSFTYDADGMRTSRSDGSRTYNYIYNGSSLSQLMVEGHTMRFTYDASGSPLSVTYDGTEYYYALNLQGDVVAILNGSGSTVVAYTYDAWGNILSTTGDLSGTLGFYNPLRYRGYVYDAEYGLYYLQSRYYEPLLGRFQSSDAFVSTGQGILGNNMFAYCLNNPVNYVDASGTASKSCLHDFTEPDSPWKDSGSGGGRPYRDYSSGPNYYGEVADKFYSIRLFKVATNGLKTGATWLWDAYMRGYNIQVEAQYKNSIALREGVAYFVEHPKKAEVLLRDMVGTSTAIATATSIAIAGGPVSAFAGALFFACVALWDVSWSIGEIVKDFQ